MTVLTPADHAPPPTRGWHSAIEVGLILTICFVVGGGPPPDVNEAHYLGKAKHYWQPTWCAGDAFLNSSDAHLVFYWCFGWLTRFLTLNAVAWVGRILVWLLFAWSFRRLTHALFGRPWLNVLLAASFLTCQQWGQMAGEWVVGGIEAKGFAFPLAFLGLEALVRSRWKIVWVCFGAAAAFHVLVGGWAVIAAMIAWSLSGKDRMDLVPMLPWLAVGGLLSLPGLWPALPLNSGVSAEIVKQANHIYVNERISHHLLLQRFGWGFVARHALLLIVWLLLLRDGGRTAAERRLGRFVLGAILIAIVGAGLSPFSTTPAVASLLRFYWFRLTDIAVPLGVVVAICGLALRLRPRHSRQVQWVTIAALLLCMANFVFLTVQTMRDPRPGADKQSLARHRTAARTAAIYSDWKQACRWVVAADLPNDTRFLTPRRQQTFKWYAGRPEVISWKDVPQDAAGLVQWARTKREIFTAMVLKHGLDSLSEQELYQLCKRHNATFVVLERRNRKRRFAFPRRFPRPGEPASYYEIYQVLVPQPTIGE